MSVKVLNRFLIDSTLSSIRPLVSPRFSKRLSISSVDENRGIRFDEGEVGYL